MITQYSSNLDSTHSSSSLATGLLELLLIFQVKCEGELIVEGYFCGSFGRVALSGRLQISMKPWAVNNFGRSIRVS
jgi:hypothetical protein